LALVTLKKRPEFLSIRGGIRASVPSFLMEAKLRPEGKSPISGPRFGFTVTKKLGGAVVRNRIRRRLKSAVTEIMGDGAKDGFDYVVVARALALERPYPDLIADVRRAFAQIHKGVGQTAAKAPARPDSTRQPGTSRKIS
jgi:ribonuclease P protein component